MAKKSSKKNLPATRSKKFEELFKDSVNLHLPAWKELGVQVTSEQVTELLREVDLGTLEGQLTGCYIMFALAMMKGESTGMSQAVREASKIEEKLFKRKLNAKPYRKNPKDARQDFFDVTEETQTHVRQATEIVTRCIKGDRNALRKAVNGRGNAGQCNQVAELDGAEPVSRG